jgi:hypothetical protein
MLPVTCNTQIVCRRADCAENLRCRVRNERDVAGAASSEWDWEFSAKRRRRWTSLRIASKSIRPLASAVALEIGRLGELNREGTNNAEQPCDSPGDALRGKGHWFSSQPRLSTLPGSHRILDPDRVEAQTPPYLHNQVPFAPAANNFPGPALVELKWASTSEFKVKAENSQHRDQHWQAGVARAPRVKMIQLKVCATLERMLRQADNAPDDA